jgi:hypothetical protein
VKAMALLTLPSNASLVDRCGAPSMFTISSKIVSFTPRCTWFKHPLVGCTCWVGEGMNAFNTKPKGSEGRKTFRNSPDSSKYCPFSIVILTKHIVNATALA